MALEREERSRRQRKLVMLAAAGVVLVLAILVAVRFMTQSAATNVEQGPVPPEVMSQITGISPSTLEQVGKGSAQVMPTPVRQQLLTGPSGLPLLSYIGAEYCPFCAGERWPLIVALSRFGTFANLHYSHSASEDVYPNTPTFTFVGSSYSSQYVEFNSVELQSNVRSGSGYQTLQTPTPAQNDLLRTYDGPPYVPAQSAGSIPFIDFGNQYVVSGATFDVGLLRGMSQSQVAAMLPAGTSDQAKAILGAANVLTAAICSMTNNQPDDVCGSPTIRNLQSTLAATPVPAGQ
ncbi:MAG: DUF929 family protein [Chloroflexi bacterium]|nr:DUF929 family protein [Chloroflexota bacterium]